MKQNKMTLKKWYPEKNIVERIIILFKYWISFSWRKMELACYLYYGMDLLDRGECRNILLDYEIQKFERAFNEDGLRYIFNSKSAFYQEFNKYIKRDVYIPSLMAKDRFYEYVMKHPVIVLKPDDSFAGKGFEIIDMCKLTDCDEIERMNYVEKLYERMIADNLISEQYLINHSAYRKIYEKSLNTIRVNTLVKKDGNVIIYACVNQFGSKGSITDNDEENGIWAAINIVSGIVEYAEKDDETAIHYIVHPDTKQNIIGFKNIKWDEVVELAKELALVVPSCRMIGWDIAVLEDGSTELIEGNVTPELGVWEAMTRKGLRKLFLENL